MGTEISAGNNVTLDDLYKLVLNVVEQNKEIKKQNEEIKNDVQTLRESFEEEICGLKNNISKLEEENNTLKKNLHSLELKAKKYNLVIYGLSEEEGGEYDLILDLIRSKLELECTAGDIRDIYRVGRKGKGKRPVVAEFASYKIKTEILTKAKKLKGTDVYISLDYATEDWRKRKFLIEEQKLAREKQYTSFIKNNRLYINGSPYTYEELRDKRHLQLNSQNRIEVRELEEAKDKDRNVLPVTSQTVTASEGNKRKPEESPEKEKGAKPKKHNKQPPLLRSNSRNKAQHSD